MALSSTFNKLQPPPPHGRHAITEVLSAESVDSKSRQSVGSWVASGWVLVGAFVIWWLITATHALPSYAVASPASVYGAIESSWRSLWSQTAVTLEQLVIALAAVWTLGGFFGVAIGAIPGLWPLIGILRAAYAIPIVIVYPLVSIWFGLGSTSKIVFGCIIGFLPMILMTSAAVRAIDDTLLSLFRSMGAGSFKLLRMGIVPAAFPGLVAAMRLSGSLSLAGVVVAEMLLSTNGLGYMISSSASQFQTENLYAGIVAVVAIAVAVNWLSGTIQRRVGRRWGTWGGN